MSSADAVPHGVPLNFSFAGDSIYFHRAPEGKKINLLSTNRRVSFCVVGSTHVLPEKFGTKYESVVATGNIEELFAEEKHRGLVLLVQKYSLDYVNEGFDYINGVIDKTRVFRVCLESITGKASK